MEKKKLPRKLSIFVFMVTLSLSQVAMAQVFTDPLAVDPPMCVAAPSGMVGWWPGDGDANDIVGSNDGTLQNGATFAPGMVGQAFSFDGENDYVDFGSSTAFDVMDFTIDAWVFIDPAKNIGERRVISRDDFSVEGADGRELYVLKSSSPHITGCDGVNNRPVFAILKGDVFSSVCSPSDLTAGWHHLAGVRSGSTITLYVDGFPVASSTGAITEIISPEAPLVIGQVSPAFNGEFFDGLIDEVEIFNRALSQSEIQAIFNAGSMGKCKNQSPVARCQNVTTSTSPGVCTAPASVNNGSFDPDGDPITLAQSPAGPYGKGTTDVTLTVTDNQDASDSCPATVTVVDNEKPSISCPSPQPVECTSPSGATASYGPPTVSDNCTGAITTGCTPPSGSSFALGTTSVSCSATDDSGNSSSCGSSVTVRDTTAPTVSCVPVPKVKKGHHDDDKVKFKRGLFQVSASDICSAFTITLGGNVLANGEIIKITPKSKPGIRLVGREHDDDDDGDDDDDHDRRANLKHFLVGPGEAVIKAKDAAGNIGNAACPVPQRHGDDDDDDRDDHKKKGKK